MREFELVIDEALRNGLSPEQMTPDNLQVLYKAYGFRCGKIGLEKYSVLTNPLDGVVDTDSNWPYPVVFSGELYNLVYVRDLTAGEDRIYSFNDDFTAPTLIATIDHAVIGIGTLPEVVDFGEYLFLTNGVAMVYYDVATTTWQKVTSITEVPLMRTICNFKGQAVGGHIESAWYDCDETYYVWSNIGSMDFTLSRYNEAGYRRDPYGGEVVHTRRLGDTVVGYSTEGIILLFPAEQTFGTKEIYDTGILNRGAQAGSLSKHVFVDADCNIVEITSEGIKELGYAHLIRPLSTEDVIVNYDPLTKDFYIGNSEITYLLSSTGLTEIQQHPSTVFKIAKQSYCIPDTEDDDFRPLIIGESFNFGYAGQKTVFALEADYFNGSTAMMGVDLSYDMNSWIESQFSRLNDQGTTSYIAAGNQFRIKLKFDIISDGFRISYMKARYKMTDLRGIRGVYAPPPRGQS